MKTPKRVNEIELVATCAGIGMNQWNNYMDKTVKANGKQIRLLIKKHLPDLYEALALDYYNPHEYKAVKKKGLLVYVHSGIEYFLQFN